MTLRLPSFWSGMGYTAKTGYLCATNQARDYGHACQILRDLRKRPRAVPPMQQVVARMEQRKLW